MEISKEAQILLNTKVVQEYRATMIEALHCSFPGLNVNELNDAIIWAIINNYQNKPAKIDNNYTKKTLTGTELDILRYIESLDPIMTNSGVLYKQHKRADNPLNNMVQGFLKQRKIFKKEMFKYPKGSAEFAKYNLLQLLEKLNANATYGKIM